MRFAPAFAFVVPLFISDLSLAGELNVAHFDQQVGVGYGYNPVNGEIHPPCIQVKSVPASGDIAGQPSSTLEITKIDSISQFKQSLNLHAYASTFGAVGSVGTHLSSLVTQGLSSTNTYFSVRVAVKGLSRVIDGDITLTDSAKKALKVSPEFFKSACGDSYITTLTSGGEFVALVELSNVTQEQADTFSAELNAGYATGSVDAGAASDFKKLQEANSIHVSIAQTGQTTNSPASLTDPNQLLKFALEFANDLEKSASIPSAESVLYSSYSNSLEFKLALHDANIDRFRNFDPSVAVMQSIMDAYDLSVDRTDLIQNALNNPADFTPFDKQTAKDAFGTIIKQRDVLGAAAKACAQAASDGLDCAISDTSILLVETLPPGITPVAACNLATFRQKFGSAGNSCSRVASVNGSCSCMECNLFTDSEYKKGDGQAITGSCVGFSPFTPLQASISAKLSFPSNPHDHWYMYYFNGELVDNIGNLIGSESELSKLLPGTPTSDANGVFSGRIDVAKCQTNVAQVDPCVWTPKEPSAGGLVTVRVK